MPCSLELGEAEQPQLGDATGTGVQTLPEEVSCKLEEVHCVQIA